MLASLNGRTDAVALLLDRGASIETKATVRAPPTPNLCNRFPFWQFL
jgi:ankyrin repeat protein